MKQKNLKLLKFAADVLSIYSFILVVLLLPLLMLGEN